MCAPSQPFAPRHVRCFVAGSVLRNRPVLIRELSLYRDSAPPVDGRARDDDRSDVRVHARSYFQSLQEPDCFALYSVTAVGPGDGVPPLLPPFATEDHTLTVVREFRRVPLDASGLGLMTFTARAGRAARVLATLAHWMERAVSAYQPSYLLLAHSREHPCLSALMAGVHERRAFEWARSSPLSVDPVLGELESLLEEAPARCAYWRDGAWAVPTPPRISPYAV